MSSAEEWPRVVSHIDMDAFYVSVELRRRPELRGLPVIVAGTGPRAVVTTASYEARRFGVGSAMPAARARRLCPDGVLVEPDFAYYREASREVMAIVRAHVDNVEVIGLDEAYLDLTGLAAPSDRTGLAAPVDFTGMAAPLDPTRLATPANANECRPGRPPEATMRLIRQEIERATALRCSVGIGPSKLVAKVASDAEKPGGFVVLTREQARERFRSAHCGLVPGIGPKTAERLRARGIATLGELAAIPHADLATTFGARLAGELQRRARFEDDAPVTEERKVVSESRELTFDRDIADPTELETILERLVERLCAALIEQRRRGRTVGIKVRLDDFSTHTRARTLAEPVAERDRLGPVALELLRRFDPPRPVRLLGVRVAGLEHVDPTGEGQLVLAV